MFSHSQARDLARVMAQVRAWRRVRHSLVAGYWALDSMRCGHVRLSADARGNSRPAETYFSPVTRKASKVRAGVSPRIREALNKETLDANKRGPKT